MAYEGTNPAAVKSIEHHQLTKSIQTLMGIITGIAADNQLSNQEIQFLSTWLSEYPGVTKRWPGYLLANRIREALKDGVITETERSDILQTLQHLIGIEFNITGASTPNGPTLPIEDDPSIFFKNMTFCFTGRFLFGTRARCERIVLSLGAMPLDRITKKLNYLVIGTLIEPSWSHTTFGNKINSAVQYRDSGTELCIVSERQWTDALADVTRNHN
ncbi:MAG: BRCT domain-containing protein [Nitrosomonas sp.]|nr:BRCT domain-containing protein [Nitrosomonas sp.]